MGSDPHRIILLTDCLLLFLHKDKDKIKSTSCKATAHRIFGDHFIVLRLPGKGILPGASFICTLTMASATSFPEEYTGRTELIRTEEGTYTSTREMHEQV